MQVLAPMAFALAALCSASDNPAVTHAALSSFRTDHIQSDGWLKTFLQRQKSGLSGHPAAMGYPFDSCLWAGEIPKLEKGDADDWWRYEQTAYYVDGIARLGKALGDAGLSRLAAKNVDYVLKHQKTDGLLGPTSRSRTTWPMSVFFRAMKAEFERTQDRRILESLRRYYGNLTEADIKPFRGIVSLEGMCWTYLQTGDRVLLEKAEALWRAWDKVKPNPDVLNGPILNSSDTVVMHGVSYLEMVKLPVWLYMATGKQVYLELARKGFENLVRDHLQVDGVPTTNEYLAGKNPLWSHETCDISDYTWSVGCMLEATGEAVWADRIERACFNAGPGAVSKDFRSFQYFSSVNQVNLTQTSDPNPFRRGTTWMAYRSANETECCAGNVHRFMPNYVLRQWLRAPDGAVVAALYGPSIFSTKVGGGAVTIHEQTNYPFSQDITFRIEASKPTRFPLRLRIPGWCQGATVAVNGKAVALLTSPGTFVTLDRIFKLGDVITLQLPMTPKIERSEWFLEDGRNAMEWTLTPQTKRVGAKAAGLFVECGPLLFSMPVRERVQKSHLLNLFGLVKGTKAFPPLDITPTSPWAYAIDQSAPIKLCFSPVKGYPFNPVHSPIRLVVPARVVKNWILDREGLLQEPPAIPDLGEPTSLTLVPYGCTRLRVTVFPEITKSSALVPTPASLGAASAPPFKRSSNSHRANA